jgi:hypothetical protein
MTTDVVLVGALLLIWAGAAKTARPGSTARALRSAGLPAPAAVVRGLATLEVAVGAGAVAVGGRTVDAAMAVSYGAFAVFVGAAIARGWALSSCGCFGEVDARPTRGHLIINAVFGVAAAAAAVTGGARPLAGFGRHPAQGAALAVTAAVTAGLVVLVLTRPAELHTGTRSR